MTARRSAALSGLAAASLAATLSGCGFHPRGSLGGLDEPGRLFLDADRGLSIEEPLREALRERAFSIAANRDAADIVLRVADERMSQRIVSVRSTGRVSEFELAHAVRMAISRPGEPAAGPPDAAPARAPASTDASTDAPADPPPDAVPDAVPTPTFAAGRSGRVEVRREYTYDESQVLGKENEARILRDEMGDELVRQIVLRTVASLAREAAIEADGVAR